jgi:hypothetical protein
LFVGGGGLLDCCIGRVYLEKGLYSGVWSYTTCQNHLSGSSKYAVTDSNLWLHQSAKNTALHRNTLLLTECWAVEPNYYSTVRSDPSGLSFQQRLSSVSREWHCLFLFETATQNK